MRSSVPFSSLSCGLLVLFAMLAPSQAQLQPAPLVLLNDPQARCLDGTQSGFYVQPNTTASGGRTFVLHLEGGGECATSASCWSRVTSSMGSSKYFNATRWLWGLASQDQQSNPDFYDATHVLLPYCSGDLWTGTVTQPSAGSFELYFSGHLNVVATIDALVAEYGLVDSPDTQILLSGDSAGGIGTWIQIDYIAARFPQSRVVAVPLAGFYFTAYPYAGPGATQSYLANFTAEGLRDAYAAWQSFVDTDCAGALASDPSPCLLANNSFPYITAESFAFESQTDQVVLTAHDSIPGPPGLCGPDETAYVLAWSANMSVALAPLADPANARNGVYNPACFFHVGFYDPSLRISGIAPFEALGNWFFQRTGPEGYKLADRCEPGQLYCNPTCAPAAPNPCSGEAFEADRLPSDDSADQSEQLVALL